MVYMKILKRNQIIVTVIALMLVAAGYLNFANQNRENNLILTSLETLGAVHTHTHM